MNIAMQYCDYIIALKKGKIVAAGIPMEVLTAERIRELFRVQAEIQRLKDNEFYIRYLGAANA